MQTFFNPTTPFLDGDGKPLVGARVSFFDLETNASLISLTDYRGTALPNPIFTGVDGRLRLENGNGAPAVPCIEDGLSYKVTVARRTGVEPVYIGGILQNASELYEEPDIAFVVTSMNEPENDENSATVAGVADVRIADKSLGSVVCCGYYTAGDCPSRVFTWVESVSPPADNGINILRNPEDGSGYWMMGTPDSGMWDVRVAGLSTSNTPSMNSLRLTALQNFLNSLILSSLPVNTVYFPAGNWVLDGGFTFDSVVLENGANIKPSDNDSDRVVNIAHLENRGGKFYAYDTTSGDSKRMLLRTSEVVHTSWFVGTINEFLKSDYLNDSRVIVFDNNVVEGTHQRTFSQKLVIVKNNIPSSIEFYDSIFIDILNKRVIANNVRVGELVASQSEYEEDGEYYPSVKYYFGRTLVAEVDSRRGFVVTKISADDIVAENIKAENAELSFAKINNIRIGTSSNEYFVETEDDFDASELEATKGDVLFLVNEDSNQILVTCNSGYNQETSQYYHDRFPLNSYCGVALLCIRSYDPTTHGGATPSRWAPLTSNAIISRVVDN